MLLQESFAALRKEFGVEMSEVRSALEVWAVCRDRGIPSGQALQEALEVWTVCQERAIPSGEDLKEALDVWAVCQERGIPSGEALQEALDRPLAQEATAAAATASASATAMPSAGGAAAAVAAALSGGGALPLPSMSDATLWQGNDFFGALPSDGGAAGMIPGGQAAVHVGAGLVMKSAGGVAPAAAYTPGRSYGGSPATALRVGIPEETVASAASAAFPVTSPQGTGPVIPAGFERVQEMQVCRGGRKSGVGRGGVGGQVERVVTDFMFQDGYGP